MRLSGRGKTSTGRLAVMMAGVVAGLSGCASAPTIYDLRPAPASAKAWRATVAVDVPSAAPPLDTDLVVVREGDDSLARLPNARWADRLTLLVQNRTIQTFENAGVLRQLRAPGNGAAFHLVMSVRRFDIDAPRRVARVEIAAQLVSEGGRVAAAKLFSASEPVGEIAGPEATQALDGAFRQILPQLAAWTAAAT